MKKDNTYILRLLFPLVSFAFHFGMFLCSFFLISLFLFYLSVAFDIYAFIEPCNIDLEGEQCSKQAFNSFGISFIFSVLITLLVNYIFRKKIQKSPLEFLGIVLAFIFLNIFIRYPIVLFFDFLFIQTGFIISSVSIYLLKGFIPSTLSIIITYFVLRELQKDKK